MAYYAIPLLIEAAVATRLNSESFMSSVNGAHDALGTNQITFPSVIVECTGGTEEPENSGNYKLDVEIKVYGGMDPDNDGTFIDATVAHTNLCGNVHHWITATIAAGGANWLGNITDTNGNNVLKVHRVRLAGFTRDLNPSAGVFEDTFTLEIYAQEEPRT